MSVELIDYTNLLNSNHFSWFGKLKTKTKKNEQFFLIWARYLAKLNGSKITCYG